MFRINAEKIEFAAVKFDELLKASGHNDIEMGEYKIRKGNFLSFFDNISKTWFNTKIHMNSTGTDGQWMSDQYLTLRRIW